MGPGYGELTALPANTKMLNKYFKNIGRNIMTMFLENVFSDVSMYG
jgi:hypothetical protein